MSLSLWPITFIAEDDFRDVNREVISLKAHYYNFGVELGLPAQELDAIRTAFNQNIDQAFTEVLLVWLRHRYKVERYGPPTWRRLVEAVDSPAGGNKHALAKAIALKYPPGMVCLRYEHSVYTSIVSNASNVLTVKSL